MTTPAPRSRVRAEPRHPLRGGLPRHVGARADVAEPAASALGAPPLRRRVAMAFLTPAGRIEEASRIVPSLPAFEEPFAAFARGTMVPCSRGHLAVEDLWPGTEVRVGDGRLARLLWRGSTMIVPQAEGQEPAMTRLTRLSADALGYARPFQDLVLGPRARLVNRRPGVRLLTGREAASVPAADMVDGVAAAHLAPAAPVEVFHLAFERHETLLANGVEVESYHPGPLHGFALRGEQLALFLSCFPHLPDLLAFGEPALPRLRGHELELFDAA